jgi:hypothetical protein
MQTNARQVPSVIGLANIECATIGRFYERIFHKNAKSFLLEFLIVRIWVICDCDPDRDSRLVGHHTSSDPYSGIVRRSFRGFSGLQEGRCFFCYRDHIVTSINLSPSSKLQAPTSQPRCQKLTTDFEFEPIRAKQTP